MFRFTIRDVLWLTVLVAMATCWAIESTKFRAALKADFSAELARKDKEFEKLGSITKKLAKSNTAAAYKMAAMQQASQANAAANSRQP